MIANIPLITSLGYLVQFMNLLIIQLFVHVYDADQSDLSLISNLRDESVISNFASTFNIVLNAE